MSPSIASKYAFAFALSTVAFKSSTSELVDVGFGDICTHECPQLLFVQAENFSYFVDLVVLLLGDVLGNVLPQGLSRLRNHCAALNVVQENIRNISVLPARGWQRSCAAPFRPDGWLLLLHPPDRKFSGTFQSGSSCNPCRCQQYQWWSDSCSPHRERHRPGHFHCHPDSA